MIERMKYSFDGFVNCFYWYWSEFEIDGGIAYMIIRNEGKFKEMDSEEILIAMSSLGFYVSDVYNGPGRPYRQGAHVKWRRRYIIVTVDFGYDV